MKHQPYKAFFLFSYISSSEIHKRSNILMTIKLSTTNSVNKTLQHKKALWDLETLCGDSRGYSEGRAPPTPPRRFLFLVFFVSFSLRASGSTGFWVTVMRSGFRGVANASNPSSSVNKVSSRRSGEVRCHAGTQGENNKKNIVGPSSDHPL